MKRAGAWLMLVFVMFSSGATTAGASSDKAELLSYSAPSEAIEILNMSLERHIQSGDYKEAAQEMIWIANACKLQGNFDEALFNLFNAREIITIHLPKDSTAFALMGVCLETIGEIYYYRFMEQKAVGFYFDALWYFGKIPDYKRSAEVLQLLVESELALKDTARAKMVTESLRLMSGSTQLKEVEAQYFTAMASICSAHGQSDSAIFYYENAWKIFRQSNDVFNASKILGAIAEICIETGKFEEALKWSETGIAFNTRHRNTAGYFEMVYYKSYASGFFDVNNSISIAESALDSISKTKFLFHEGVFYNLLVNIYTGRNDQKALIYMQKYLDVYKNVYGMASEQHIADMTLRVFTDRLNIHIENLMTKQELNERIRNGQQNMIFYFVIALLVLLLISVGNLKKLQFRMFLFRDYVSDLIPLPVFFLAFVVYGFLLLWLFKSPLIHTQTGFIQYLHLFALAVIPSLIIALGLASLPAIWSSAPEKNRSFSRVTFSGLMLIYVLVISYNLIFGLMEFNLYEILNVIFTYTGLIVVPLFFIVIYIEKVLLRKRTQEAGFMNIKIRESEMHQKPGVTRIRIVSDKSKDVFESFSTDLLLVEGQSNYTKFYFIANDSLKTSLLLMTLKQAESQLQNHKEFIRCHKSNIVNLTCVKKVRGNSHGYKLSVPPIEEPVTVSKSYISEFNEAFNRLSADDASINDN